MLVGQVVCRLAACPKIKEVKMPNEFHPLADIASFMMRVAQALPPLPPPPFQPSQSPKVEAPKVRPPSSPSINYVDVENGVIKASMEKHRAGQAAKGLVPFVYE